MTTRPASALIVRRILTGAALLAVGAIAFVVYWRTLGFFPRRDAAAKVEYVEALVNDNIKLGDSLDAVSRALQKLRVSYAPLAPYEANFGGREYHSANAIVAIECNVGSSSLVVEDLQVIFLFDDQLKLASIHFEPIMTGP